jgi:hypothetical protein
MWSDNQADTADEAHLSVSHRGRNFWLAENKISGLFQNDITSGHIELLSDLLCLARLLLCLFLQRFTCTYFTVLVVHESAVFVLSSSVPSSSLSNRSAWFM